MFIRRSPGKALETPTWERGKPRRGDIIIEKYILKRCNPGGVTLFFGFMSPLRGLYFYFNICYNNVIPSGFINLVSFFYNNVTPSGFVIDEMFWTDVILIRFRRECGIILVKCENSGNDIHN